MKLQHIFERLGGPARVAAICGVSRQAVIQWKRIPVHFVLVLAREATARPVTPHDMRPDVYPHPLDGRRAPGARPAARA